MLASQLYGVLEANAKALWMYSIYFVYKLVDILSDYSYLSIYSSNETKQR